MKQIHSNILNHFDIKQFQMDLISWFEKEQRELPWRQDKDPYKIWVSEIMLQQTKVDTVIPYFESFINQFPTIQDLANADEEKVLKAWEGLGYYSRVRNLHSAVKEVHENYGDQVPNNVEEISKLKGIGPYTTGAILSIAYGKPEPAVDGNVMRVLSRILNIKEDIAKVSTRKLFEEVVRKMISTENPSFFNQALMELGALICIPKNPACLLCPVQDHCRAFHEGVQGDLPIKSKKKTSKTIHLGAIVLSSKDGKFVIHKRPKTGLLANLWEFLNWELPPEQGLEKDYYHTKLKKEYGIEADIGSSFASVEHVFSHLIWNIRIYSGVLNGNIKETETIKLVKEEELKEFAFPVSHQKIFELYKERKNC